MLSLHYKALPAIEAYNPSNPWHDNVLKIIGVSEVMKRLDAHRVFDALERIEAYEKELRRRSVEEGHGDDEVTQTEKDRLVKSWMST